MCCSEQPLEGGVEFLVMGKDALDVFEKERKEKEAVAATVDAEKAAVEAEKPKGDEGGTTLIKYN